MLKSNRVTVIYQWDSMADDFVDLTRYIDGGITIMVKRNAVGTATLKVKYRAILSIMKSSGLSLAQFLNEWLSTVQISQDDGLVFAGVLDGFPEVSSNSLDADISLSFVSWLGLLKGIPVIPTQVLTGNLDRILVAKVRDAISVSSSGAAPYPITIGDHIDSLPAVTWTVDNMMNLKDFLVQRCDNATGAGNFDINITADGRFQIWKQQGYDTSQKIIFKAGDASANIQSLDFPRWEEPYTDAIISGAGNGYGDDGSVITAHAVNASSRKRHFYYCTLAQDSSISTQDVLNRAATKQIKYSSSPISTPTITINATALKLKVCEHDLGGDLWVGDTVGLDMSGIYSGIPLPPGKKTRIDQLDITIDPTYITTVKMTMCDITGDTVNVSN